MDFFHAVISRCVPAKVSLSYTLGIQTASLLYYTKSNSLSGGNYMIKP